MSKKNQTPVIDEETVAVPEKKAKKKKKKGSGWFGRLVRRFFLLVFTVIFLAAGALILVMNLIFNGPSPAMRDTLTMSLIEASATKWVPALFIGEETVAQIRESVKGAELPQDVSTSTQVVIQKGNAINATSDEWANYPDGIRFEEYAGSTYNAHIMIVRDPSTVYIGVSNENGFSRNVPGKRITEMMESTPDAVAAVNAGAFFDNGTSDPSVGSTPEGLVYSEGACVWSTGAPPNGITGFAGFNEDDVLVVSKKNIGKKEAEELNIRDGCCFGPVLLMDGEVNMEAYNNKSGLNPRTAIGQRADGAVIFVCIDGRQPSSMGGEYSDIIDIMVEYGAVNACNMDGGSSSVMMYRDTEGRYGTAGEVKMMNSYSLLQSQPRKMPNFWMVRSAE